MLRFPVAKPAPVVIHIGTCGYSYADWKGPFYPAAMRSADMLEWYARSFTCVEIDATYYRVPSRATFSAMAARVPADFRFCLKLPGTATHLAQAALGRVPDDVVTLRRNIEPLVASGRCAALLMQFPNGFHPSAAARAHITALRDALADLPLVAEFRNRAWQTHATLTFLAAAGIGWVNVDMPRFDTLMAPGADATAPVAYVRFHGRNDRQWWRGDNVTRYDYDYSAAELGPWADRLLDLAANDDVRDVFGFFNNHRRGQAPRNAKAFETMLRERFPGAVAVTSAEPPQQLSLLPPEFGPG